MLNFVIFFFIIYDTGRLKSDPFGFPVLTAEFQGVRCFYALICGTKWLNRSIFDENRVLRSVDILNFGISSDIAYDRTSFYY